MTVHSNNLNSKSLFIEIYLLIQSFIIGVEDKTMGENNLRDTKALLASAVAAVGFATCLNATAKVAGPPRGQDILPGAGNCSIGSFRQTTKAGQYNVLCDVMQDSEKCLAFIKGHFDRAGNSHVSSEPDKLTYCLEELERVLGADTTP